MKLLQLLYLLVGLPLFFSCKPSGNVITSMGSEKVPAYASDFINQNSQFQYSFKLNSQGNWMLCIEQPKNSRSETRYSVYETSTDSLVYNGAFIGGEISWYNGTELKLTNNSRLEGETSFQVISIQTGESRVVKSELKGK